MYPPKKIIYIGNQLRKGDERTLTTIDTLSNHLRSEGFLVISASAKKNKAARLLDMLFTIFIHKKGTKAVLIDTYSTQNFWYAVAVGNLCRLLQLPYIPILHGGNLPTRLKKSEWQAKKLFHGAKINVAPSYYLLEVFQREGYQNTICIPNTIETKKYAFKHRASVLPKLLWVRSFAEIYNPLLALKIIDKIRELYPIAALCMVGPDKDGSLERCKKYAKEKNLPVTFTGKLSKEAWTTLAKDYDIFINTTHFDNTPVSVIEAIALGLPVISTNVGGVSFLLENKKDALLVPDDDTEAFVEAIVHLCNTSSLTKVLVENARRKAEGFDWENVKHLWDALLKD
ncbi:MAG: glycosyltransferase family 4 protein [Flavobacteriaceae bacterium]